MPWSDGACDPSSNSKLRHRSVISRCWALPPHHLHVPAQPLETGVTESVCWSEVGASSQVGCCCSIDQIALCCLLSHLFCSCFLADTRQQTVATDTQDRHHTTQLTSNSLLTLALRRLQSSAAGPKEARSLSFLDLVCFLLFSQTSVDTTARARQPKSHTQQPHHRRSQSSAAANTTISIFFVLPFPFCPALGRAVPCRYCFCTPSVTQETPCPLLLFETQPDL
ncbi:uncharacterized protein QC761_120910 [Podospora bellae-mahoneyi]|uniref:Uncharacterized protein n=1 Tax=Podospora bellae-mahoneyi TaxID=2093777 RepID=A0ABR0G1U1_9PEZI|nr:hypothetical protein QC761_120910 [Podospora bellae-mahoneyi]